MTAALDEHAWDVIISDYSLPTFDAPAALSLVRERNMDIPFIVVSGTAGEDKAVEAMRVGVHDFLFKGQLRRLVAAIERELREATIRAERRKIQEQLLISDRMASVGTLAAGIAHEINNPLAVVLGNLQSIARTCSNCRAASRRYRRRGPASDVRLARLQSTAASLRTPCATPTRPASACARSCATCASSRDREEEIREPVDVHGGAGVVAADGAQRDPPPRQRRAAFGDVPRVFANEARLGQVFLNLIVNAAQAIPEGERRTRTRSRSRPGADDMVAIEVTRHRWRDRRPRCCRGSSTRSSRPSRPAWARASGSHLPAASSPR